jgi:arylsulfatase A-like enzyme
VSSAESSARPKHFVVALIDDLGGYNVPWRNPLQKMADDLLQLSTVEGMRLDNFYTYKYCSPTRSSFLSARFALHVNENQPHNSDPGGIDLRMSLLPQKLRSANYRSYMIGKGHIGARSRANLPINRGFDHHLGFLGGGEDHYTQRIAQGVDLWEDNGPALGKNGTYSCNLYSARAVELVEDHAAHYASQGMFMYLPFHCTHAPYEAEERFLDPTCPDKGRQTMQAMVSCVSEGTGNVTRALKRTGMWADTLFLWSSDNGGPQYWVANNYPLRGGKGTDFEGGVSTAAFVTGGALSAHLFGQVSTSPMHVADLHYTICLMAGVPEVDCRDDDVPGVPPIDGVDFRAAFTAVNLSRPLAKGTGPSAGTHEMVLSSNTGGAYIDFNLSNGGPWKFVRNTVTVIKNPASPNGSGYWTGPVWPVGNNHTPLIADPGCPEGGCLFNLRLDRLERKELSKEQPARRAAMAARMETLIGTRFQTGSNYTGGMDNCTTLAAVVNENHGESKVHYRFLSFFLAFLTSFLLFSLARLFLIPPLGSPSPPFFWYTPGFIGPCCVKGSSWSSDISCGARTFTRYAADQYRGTWACEGKQEEQALTARDDALPKDGGAIGFALLKNAEQPAPGSKILSVQVDIRAESPAAESATGCSYIYGGIIVGMARKNAGSIFRDQFSGYSIAVTGPWPGSNCTKANARLAVRRHDVGTTHGAAPTSELLASFPLGAVSMASWFALGVSANATHMVPHVGGVTYGAVPLVPDKPIGCIARAPITKALEPWEPVETSDACAVGVYQHRVRMSWRSFVFGR